MEKYTYWLILLCSFIFPFLFSFENRMGFYKQWKYLFPAILITATFFIIWDHYFTIKGIWSFSERYTTGIKLFSLPIEEIMFFFIIPYCCVFIYESLNFYIRKAILKPAEKFISFMLLMIFLILAVTHTNKAYTFYTCLFAGLYLGGLLLFRVTIMSRFYLAYLVSKIPFLIVNGILTSLPVVIYNDQENLGLRIYTIPVDDLIYSFLMILMSISLMEFFRGKARIVN
jgi:lycopene cyclase domain-containing protein